MQGKIVKGIAGFYYVHVVESGVYECKAKGVFRKEKIKPLVGDNVIIEALDEEQKTGNITEVLKRKNELVRPAVANIDQALVVFVIVRPNPVSYTHLSDPGGRKGRKRKQQRGSHNPDLQPAALQHPDGSSPGLRRIL